MIVTVTFNPAIDYTLTIGSFRIGEINRTSHEILELGGKGINVSRVLKTLGFDSLAIGYLAGFSGRLVEAGLKEAGIQTDFIWQKEGQTRINVKIKSEEETEINGSGPTVDKNSLNMLLYRLECLKEGDALVLAGNVSQGVPSDVYGQILERQGSKKIMALVDAAGDLLLMALPFRPFLIKPNNLELGQIFGKTLSSHQDIIHCARLLQKEGARNVLVSMAGQGSILLTEDGLALSMEAAIGKVQNSVGAGDSMVAGFLAGYLSKGDFGEALRLGTAAGGASAFSKALASGQDIYKVMESLGQPKRL
jgi:1-phosphofructokinase